MSSKKIHPGKASFWVLLGRSCVYSGQDMARNLGMVIITISILVLALLTINVLLAVRGLTASAIAAVEKQVDVTVYFEPSAPSESVNKIKEMINSWPQVTGVEFLDAEQVLAAFKNRHANNPEILHSLELLGKNPLGAQLIIRARQSADYSTILAALDQPAFKPLVQQRSFEDRTAVIERVALLTGKAQRLSLGLALVFFIIALLIVFNAVRVAIYTQREEITIKRLVGATNGFIRAPFFVEGWWYAVVSMVVVAALIYCGARILDPYLGPLFTSEGFSLQRFFFGEWWWPLGSEAVGLVLVVWGTAWLAMRKYLRT